MKSTNRRPSFLVFCVDQMQAAAMGCAGHPEVRTPNLDRLAGEGVRFSRAYCENPVCMPSRISILTGLSSRQHGVYCNGQLLPSDIPTVTSALREAGYRTKACGKLHLQPWHIGWHTIEELRSSMSGHGGRILDGVHSCEEGWQWREGNLSEIPAGYFGFESVDFVQGHIGYIRGDYLNWLKREHPEWGRELANEQWERSRSGEDYQASYYHDPNALTPGGIADTWRMDIPPEIHHNNWIADRTIDYLDSLNRDENFFVWCSFPDPHHPFAACKPYSEMYDPESLSLPPHWETALAQSDLPMSSHGFRLDHFNEAGLREMLAQTYGMISHIDDNVGRVMQALERNGRVENTVVVFMADHGDYLGAHHLVCKGVFPFEELIRVPYIWHSPTSEARGREVAVPVSLLDFAPTVLDYADVPLQHLLPRLDFAVNSEVPWFDGVSLSGSIECDEQPRTRPLIITKEESSVNGQDDGPEVRCRCFVRDGYKLVLYARHRGNCLFDLTNDPYEQNNLWDDPEAGGIRNELLREFAQESIWTEYAGVGRVGAA